MSLTATQRAALAFADRPPGPPAMWYALGTAVRALGDVFDKVGIAIQADSATLETFPIPTTGVKLDGKTPTYEEAAFIAPSANLIGAVTLGSGTSVWYSSMVSGTKAACEIGEMSTVGDRSIVVDSIIGKNVCIGAGCILSSVNIGDESSVGMGCKMLKGSSLGANAILVAGSLLPAGVSVPSGEVWGGSPAKKVGAAGEDDANGIVSVAELTSEIAKMHADEAWKDFYLIEQEHDDYKRETERTTQKIRSLRRDPGWVPLPTLGGTLSKMEAHSQTYLIK